MNLGWVYDDKLRETHKNLWLDDIKNRVLSRRLDIALPRGRYYFFICVPHANGVFIFLLAVRDDREVSLLRQLQSGGISVLCQQAVVETCYEAVQELSTRIYRQAIESKIRHDAWLDVSRWTAHVLSGEAFAAAGTLRSLKEVVSHRALEHVRDLRAAISEIGQVCNDLRLYSGLRPLKFRRISVVRLLRRLVHRLRHSVAPRRLTLLIHESLPYCRWDPVHIRHALQHLIVNAVQNSPTSAAISISAEPKSRHSAREIEIVVFNTGPGVKVEDKRRIFEGYTSRPTGTGIGLLNVSQIVNKHGGRIHEEGTPGKNARFVIRIPATPKTLS